MSEEYEGIEKRDRSVIIVVGEDDDGHAALIRRNLKRAGVANEILRFADGEEVLDFFFQRGEGEKRRRDHSYLLLLDIRMPKIDGVEVLARIKEHEELRKMPVIMLTTTDDPKEVERCHELGCSHYITKPIDHERFVETLRQMGLFLLVVQVPRLH